MRIITVDNGNTNPHVGIYLDEFQSPSQVSVVPLAQFVQAPDDYILISDVGSPIKLMPSFDLKEQHKNNRFFDMPVDYAETLGDDRLIIGYSLFKKIKAEETILAIDAGTFITMDVITPKGFAGGFIFPGLTAFLSTYQRGSNLPGLGLEKNYELKDLAHTTKDAILGAADIYLGSILESVIKKTSPNKIVITGGSLEYILNKISKLNLSKVQLVSDPHLIHSSLYEIFQRHLRLTKS